jgi:hypothetical protein
MKSRIIILLLLIAGCNTPTSKEQKVKSSRQVNITLVDSFGQISLSVPARYDTFFSWINYSDCGKPCNRQEYRYQPKILPITKESGFYWFGEPKDSVDRLTVIHSSEIQYKPSNAAIDSIMYKELKRQIIRDSTNSVIIYDTLEKIGDRYFSVFALQNSDTIHNIRVLAVTIFKGNEITFSYDLLTKKEDSIEMNFIKNSLNLIHTIKFN